MRRWLRWNVVCRRGRRCADVVLQEVVAGINVAPEGSTVRITYTCGNCGTNYERETLLGARGSFVELDRTRIR